MGRPTHSFVVPVFNEEAVLEQFYARLTAVADSLDDDFEIIFVDDGSLDATPVMLRELVGRDSRIRVLQLSRNFGHQAAITAGLDAAEGDAVVVLDCDLQDPPEVITQLVARWKEGAEIVFAVRTARRDPLLKRLLARAFYRVLRRASSAPIPVDAGDFRLIDRRAVLAFRELRERSRYVRGMMAWVGFRQSPVYFERDERAAGNPKYSFGRSLRLAMDGLISFSDLPLRATMVVGLLISFGAFLVGAWAIALKIAGAYVAPGWVSILAPLAFLAGIQLIVLGVLGIYLGRVFDEVKQRPVYIIRDSYGFEAPLDKETLDRRKHIPDPVPPRRSASQ
jgi:glycosyltransferase involved in cell wall biosynthesis